MALKRFRADRSFDGFEVGQEIELDPDREWDARQIATGYLEELEDAPAEEPAGDESVDLGDTAPSDAPAGTDAVTTASTTKASRRRAAVQGEGDGTTGQQLATGGSGQ